MYNTYVYIFRRKQLCNTHTQNTLQPNIDAASSLEPVSIEVIDPEENPSHVGQGQRLKKLASPITKEGICLSFLPWAMKRGL